MERQHIKNALYQQAIGGSGAEFAANESEFFLRWLAAGLTISPAGIITLAQPPIFSAASLTNIPAASSLAGLSLATLVAGDLLVATGASALARLADVAAGQILASGGIGVAPAWSAAPAFSGANITALDAAQLLTGTVPVARLPAGAMTLLKANSGTDTTAAAANVDTIAISGLTALDMLVIDVDLAAVTQQTAAPTLYNNTDAVSILLQLLAGGNLAAGARLITHTRILQAQSGATTVAALGVGGAGGALVANAVVTFTTNWTGSWTLALRHAGVTAGGTLRWRWSVYKVAGQ